MDVIALHRAGFPTAVAPLGTALTETQIEELWRLAPEPVLCFDGDAAGQRAASRALDRALPLLEARHSACASPRCRRARTPTRSSRARARTRCARCSTRRRPLAEVLWTIETAQPARDAGAPRRAGAAARGPGPPRSPTASCRSITAISSARAWPRPSMPARGSGRPAGRSRLAGRPDSPSWPGGGPCAAARPSGP